MKKNTAISLIRENIEQLSQIPRIIANIERDAVEAMPGYKNSLIRFQNERKIILLDEIKTLKNML